MIEIAAKSSWRFLAWLPKHLLKRKFSKIALANLIDFDVMPRHESVSINLGHTSSFNISLVLTNRSPFEVELDRAKIEILCCGLPFECYILERASIPSGEKKDFFLRGIIPNEHADAIFNGRSNHQTGLSVTAEFNCVVHNFQKRTQHLGGVRTEFVNTQWRTFQRTEALNKCA
jgi:hypothetical protein